MMKFARIIRSFFQAVSSVSRMNRENTITFSDRVYMHLPDTKITLMSLAPDTTQAIELSTNDAKAIFRSIKRAVDLHQVEEIKTDDWSWKTDARGGWQGTVVIEFHGPMGSTTEVLKREAVTAAVTEFANRFDLS
jgi:hypothetical protein